MPIDGTDELEKNLKKFMRDVVGGKGLEDALAAAGFVGEAGAKLRAAVDTGNMRAATSLTDVKLTRTGGIAIIAAEAEYSVHVEFGTSKQKAQPFMRPTIDEDDKKMTKAFEDQATREIRKAFS